jgi:hypothetical protein
MLTQNICTSGGSVLRLNMSSIRCDEDEQKINYWSQNSYFCDNEACRNQVSTRLPWENAKYLRRRSRWQVAQKVLPKFEG